MAAVKLQPGWLQEALDKAREREQYWARTPDGGSQATHGQDDDQANDDDAPPQRRAACR